MGLKGGQFTSAGPRATATAGPGLDAGAAVPGPSRRTRRQSRRARATVVSAVLTLIALTIGLTVAVHRHPDVRDPLWAGRADGLAERFDAEEPGSVRVVAIGSSRTANAFHPPTAEQVVTRATGRRCVAFNAAVIGNGPVSQYMHLRRLMDRGVRADVITIEVVPALFADRGDGAAHELGLLPERLSQADVELLSERRYVDDNFRVDWAMGAANPWNTLRFQLLGQVRPKWLPPGAVRHTRKLRDPSGWLPWEEEITPEKYRTRVEWVRTEYSNIVRNIRLAEIPLRAFADTVAECRAAGAVPVTVIAPESSDFRSWYSSASLAAIDELLAFIRANTDGPVVDAREWLPDSGFTDGHHVHARAAAGFTERLVREAIVPVVGSK